MSGTPPRHLHGPVFVTTDDDAVYHEGGTTYPEQWYRDLAAGLDVAAQQLSTVLKAFEDEDFDDRLALRFRLPDDGDDSDDGDKTAWTTEGIFEDDDVPETLRVAARAFVDAAIAVGLQRGDALWGTDESHLGQSMAAWLGRTNVDDVTRLIRFMEVCDLDHEVDHGWDMARAVKAHGWCAETLALWVARNSTCCGQAGHEQDWDELTAEHPEHPTLSSWLEADPSRGHLVSQMMARATLVGLRQRWRTDLDQVLATVDEDLDLWFGEASRWLGDVGPRLLAAARDEARALATTWSTTTAEGDVPLPRWLDVLEAPMV